VLTVVETTSKTSPASYTAHGVRLIPWTSGEMLLMQVGLACGNELDETWRISSDDDPDRLVVQVATVVEWQRLKPQV